MKGYFCVNCGKEVPMTVKDGKTMFYCECNGVYNELAYFREIDDKNKINNEIEINDVLDVPYYKAREIVKKYLKENIYISVVAEKTCLDFDMIETVLHDLFEYKGD